MWAPGSHEERSPQNHKKEQRWGRRGQVGGTSLPLHRVGQMRSASPLTGGVRTVERVLEVDDGAIAVLQDALLLCVVLHQLRERCELLPSIQVIEVPRVLDPNVGHLIPHPAGQQVVRPLG